MLINDVITKQQVSLLSLGVHRVINPSYNSQGTRPRGQELEVCQSAIALDSMFSKVMLANLVVRALVFANTELWHMGHAFEVRC